MPFFPLQEEWNRMTDYSGLAERDSRRGEHGEY